MDTVPEADPTMTLVPGSIARPVREWHARLSGQWGRKGFASLLDQGLLSGTTFVAGVILARFASLNEYGAYVLAFSALTFLDGVLAALVTGPMTFLGPGRDGEALRRYVGTLAIFQVLAAAALALLLFGAAAIMWHVPAGPELRGAFLGLSVAIFSILLMNFCRRVFFMRLLPGYALINNAIFCGLQITALVLLWQLDRSSPEAAGSWLTGRNVFLLVGVSAFVPALVGLYRLRGLLRPSFGDVRGVLRDNWNFGRWGLLSSSVTLGYNQAVYFILGAFAGIEAVARFEGPRLVVAPCMMLVMAWSNLVGPASAHKLHREGIQSMVSFLKRASTMLHFLIVTFLLVILIFPGEALSILIGARYAMETRVLLIWAAIVLMMALSTSFGAVFYTARRPKLGTIGRIVGAAIGLPAALALVGSWGVAGAAFARLAAESAMAFTAAILRSRMIKQLTAMDGSRESVGR